MSKAPFLLVAACTALATISSLAAAEQPDYLYLECDAVSSTTGAATRSTFRIGDGQWDALADTNHWRPLEGTPCGEKLTTAHGSFKRVCAFSEHEFSTQITSGSGSSVFTINRFTGDYSWHASASGHERGAEGSCRKIAEPPTTGARF